jgi:orotate phosphoribosyltransferase
LAVAFSRLKIHRLQVALLMTAVEALREAGAIVVGVATIVERGAAPLLAENNLEYTYAYSLADLGL